MSKALPQDAGLLAGIRVLDLSQGIAGPCCGAILRAQGADVVKVEPPTGDWARGMGMQREGFTPVVVAYNAGKRGLCVDAGLPQGREALVRIAAQVDVVVQNFRPGVVERLGLAYSDCARLNPRLVYLSISGYGASGPMAALPATDGNMQAHTGIMARNRDGAGVPRRVGIFLADVAAAQHGAQLVSAALYRRALDGRGRHLQISLLEACAQLQASNILETAWGAPAGGPPSAPAGVFATSDGYLMLTTLNNAMFERLCHALGRPGWITDARFASNSKRLACQDVLHHLVAERLREQTTQAWCVVLAVGDVLHSAVASYEDLIADAQTRHAQIFQTVHQPGIGDLPLARVPGCAPAPVLPAPRIGQQSVRVLSDYGFAQLDIAQLVACGAVIPG